MVAMIECRLVTCVLCRGTGVVCEHCTEPEEVCTCDEKWGFKTVQCFAHGTRGDGPLVTCAGTGEVCEVHDRPRRQDRMSTQCVQGAAERLGLRVLR